MTSNVMGNIFLSPTVAAMKNSIDTLSVSLSGNRCVPFSMNAAMDKHFSLYVWTFLYGAISTKMSSYINKMIASTDTHIHVHDVHPI